jgi:hypothetical protein
MASYLSAICDRHFILTQINVNLDLHLFDKIA